LHKGAVLKWFYVLLISVAALAALIYTLLFTPPGNALLAPVVEKQINKELLLESKLERFKLSQSSFSLSILLTPSNRIEVAGNFDALNRRFNATYRVRFNDLEQLQPLSKERYFGRLHTEGNLQGDEKRIDITGQSDVAQSHTSYDVTLIDQTPIHVIADVQNADIAILLTMLGKVPYLTGKLDLDAELEDLQPATLKGDVKMLVKQGRLDGGTMFREFNASLPDTDFAFKADATLRPGIIDYSAGLDSTLLNFISQGKVSPEPLSADLTFKLDAKELTSLRSLSPMPLQGPLKLSGRLKGDQEALTLDGESDIAQSATTFSVLLENFIPRSLQANFKHIDLARLQYMLLQPPYARGTLNINADIEDARIGTLSGKIETTLLNGFVNPDVIAKHFDIAGMPKTAFSLQATTMLQKNLAITDAAMASMLADIQLHEATANLENMAVSGNYMAHIPDLNRLQFLTRRPLRGALDAEGNFSKTKKFQATLRSEVAGGELEARLNNNILKADLRKMQSQKLLWMLTYPELLSSRLDGLAEYDLLTQKGTLDTTMNNTRLTHNSTVDMLNELLKRDLYRERFKSRLKASLDKENVTADIQMASGRTELTSKAFVLDSKTKTVDGSVRIVADNYPVTLKIKGDIHKPLVKVDASELIEKEGAKILDNLLKGLF